MIGTRTIVAVIFCALCVSGSVIGAETDGSLSVDQQGPCCFENPRYSGICQVTPAPDETCGDILGYLNNPNSVGKSYCGNTKVRGGWTSVSCEGAALNLTTDSCSDSRE